VCEALKQNVQIFVFGNPDFAAMYPDGGQKKFLDWTGYAFYWRDAPGDTVDVEANTAARFDVYQYLSGIKRWNYTLRSILKRGGFESSNFGVKTSQGALYSFELLPLATNRHNEHISSAVLLCDRVQAYGSIILVPENSDDPSGFHTFLRQTLGIVLSEEPPAWLAPIVVPGQPGLDAQIAELEKLITRVNEQLLEAKDARTTRRACLEVLYQTGEPLEDAVELMLHSMGAAVSKPSVKGQCDRFLSVMFDGQEHKAVVEIKSTKNEQFTMDGLRQVMQWRTDAIMANDAEFRALFIGNSAIKSPPGLRPSPFTPQWKTSAERFEVSCITTSVLYAAYCEIQAGSLDKEEFWKLFFTTGGILNIDMLSRSEKRTRI